MKKPQKAFIFIVLSGAIGSVLGVYLDDASVGALIFSIAALGSVICSCTQKDKGEDNGEKDEDQAPPS